MYSPTYELACFSTVTHEEKLEILKAMLEALILANVLYLGHRPDTPPLYACGVPYVVEPPGRDNWQDIPRTLALREGDCFPSGTLLLRDDLEVILIDEVRVGDRIWGRDGWTGVEAKIYKGPLSVDTLIANNGSMIPLTGDHHAFIGICPKHAPHLDDGYGCSCRLQDRRIERVRLRDLQPKQVLVTPDRLPFGTGDEDPDRLYVEGLYVSEGWHEPKRFSISGQDGCPKEEQKRKVKAICEKLGIGTYWHRKHIRVYDEGWTMRMAEMGGHAPEKHLLSLNHGEVQAAATLQGVMADSRVNPSGGWTFTTTSRQLMVQVRILQKMFGRSASVAFIPDHGGLGKHPIWRLGVQDAKAKASELLRVRSIEHDVAEVPCWDIQTGDHYVYLPEHDITVSNCEDLACYRIAELRVRHGENALPYVTAKKIGTFTLFHIQVEREDGSIEDPSRILGMR